MSFIKIRSKDRIYFNNFKSNSFKVNTNFTARKIYLHSISLPLTYYNLLNNVNVDFTINAIPYSISIDGNQYLDIYQICSALQTELISIDPNFLVSYNPKTFKVTISNSSNFILNCFSGPNNTSELSLLDFLGYDLLSDTSSSTVLIAPNPPRTFEPLALHLQIAEFPILTTTNNNKESFTFQILTPSSSGELLSHVFFPHEGQMVEFSFSKEFNSLSIQLYNDSKLFDINNIDWEFTLRIEQ